MANKVMTKPWLWKRFLANSQSQYVPKNAEIVLDAPTVNDATLRVGNNTVPRGVTVSADNFLYGAARPKILSPENTVTVEYKPVITLSDFAGVSANRGKATHTATDWQVATDSSFNNIVYQSLNNSSDLTHIDLEAKNANLSRNTMHYVRVRFRSDVGNSLWSQVSAFNYVIKKYAMVTQQPSTSVSGEVISLDVAMETGRVASGVGVTLNGQTTKGAVVIYNNNNGTLTEAMVIPPHTDYMPYGNRVGDGGSMLWGQSVSLSNDGTRLAVSLNRGVYAAFAVFTLSATGFVYNGLVHVTTAADNYYSNKPAVRGTADYLNIADVKISHWFTNDTLLVSASTNEVGNAWVNDGAHFVVMVRTGTIGYRGTTAPWLRGESYGTQGSDALVDRYAFGVDSVAYIRNSSGIRRVNANGGENTALNIAANYSFGFSHKEMVYVDDRATRITSSEGSTYRHYLDIYIPYNLNGGWSKATSVTYVYPEATSGRRAAVSENGDYILLHRGSTAHVISKDSANSWSYKYLATFPNIGLRTTVPSIMLPISMDNGLLVATNNGIAVIN